MLVRILFKTLINPLLFLFFCFSRISYASEDICKFFKFCGGPSRPNSQSLPSNSAAGNLNPSNISSVKGFGIESVYQPHNPVNFNLVTGNGKIGTLISPTLENSFFGNRSIEIDDLTLERKLQKLQYQNKKLNLSLGAKLVDQTNAGLDIGLSIKRNPDIKDLNMGYGLSARFVFLNVGAYFYQDDTKFNLGNYINPYTHNYYSSIYQGSTYKEKFSVETYTIGTKIHNLSLDFGAIKTHYKFYSENTRVYLYSSSYSHNKFLFNFAIRKEESPNYEVVDKKLIFQRKKHEVYYGVNYLANSTIMFGLQYNNYLLNEWSSLITIFF